MTELHWLTIWRKGLAHQYSTEELEALRDELKSGDRIIQQQTTEPDLTISESLCQVERACGLVFPSFAMNAGLTVEEAHINFERITAMADANLGFPGAHLPFLKWFDETPWETVRGELMREVEHAIRQRERS